MAFENDMKSCGGINFEECSLFKYPFAFIDKRKAPHLIVPLDPSTVERFRTMYLTEMPRNSFNGLPPAEDTACGRWLDQMIDKGIHLIAISFDKGIIGHSALFPMENRKCEILVTIVPGYRDRGLGTQLTRCAIEFAYEAGIEKIWLTVDSQNLVARHVYVRCGFEYLSPEPSGELDMSLDLSRYRQSESIAIGTIANKKVISIRNDALCSEAINLFLKNRIGALPVVDNSNSVIGILSETDLIVETNFSMRVSDIMTKQVIAVKEKSSMATVVRLFRSKKLRCFPVVDEHCKLVGVIGRKDILEFYSKLLRKKTPDEPVTQTIA
jgi:CBS domain-containing protein/RimJ/RimL family protein N-acetyltransferase